MSDKRESKIIPPIGWGKAMAVWGYAIVWLLFLNAVKVLSYRLMKKHEYGKGRAKKELSKKSGNK